MFCCNKEVNKISTNTVTSALASCLCLSGRPGQTSGRVGFGSGQGRVTGRIGRPAPDPYLSPGRVGLARAPCAGVSGRVFFGLGRVFWPLGRVFRVGSGFGSKITARARPVDCCGSKNTARAHPPRSSGRVGSGFFRAGWVGLFGSGDPCPGLLPPAELEKNKNRCFRLILNYIGIQYDDDSTGISRQAKMRMIVNKGSMSSVVSKTYSGSTINPS